MGSRERGRFLVDYLYPRKKKKKNCSFRRVSIQSERGRSLSFSKTTESNASKNVDMK